MSEAEYEPKRAQKQVKLKIKNLKKILENLEVLESALDLGFL